MEESSIFINTTIGDENREYTEQGGIPITTVHNMTKYYTLGGEKNYKNLILYTASQFGEKSYKYENYQYERWEGIYSKGNLVENEREFIEEISKKNNVITILFHGKEWNSKRIKVVDKFIEEIEKEGGNLMLSLLTLLKDLK